MPDRFFYELSDDYFLPLSYKYHIAKLRKEVVLWQGTAEKDAGVGSAIHSAMQKLAEKVVAPVGERTGQTAETVVVTNNNSVSTLN